MTTLKELKTYVKESAEKYPHLKDEFYDLYELCLNEIDEGGSTFHEIDLCVNDIEQLIEEDGKDE